MKIENKCLKCHLLKKYRVVFRLILGKNLNNINITEVDLLNCHSGKFN